MHPAIATDFSPTAIYQRRQRPLQRGLFLGSPSTRPPACLDPPDLPKSAPYLPNAERTQCVQGAGHTTRNNLDYLSRRQSPRPRDYRSTLKSAVARICATRSACPIALNRRETTPATGP